MRKKLLAVVLIQIIFDFIPASATYGQLKLRAGAESGIYGSTGSNILEQYDFYNSLEGQIGYDFKDDIREANIKLRLKPEFYGLNDQLRTFKIRADGSYRQSEKKFNWGFRVIRQLYKFNGGAIDLNYDSFNLIFDSDWFLLNGLPFSFSTGYGNQRINDGGSQNLDLYMIDLCVFRNLNEFSKTCAGFYVEKFGVSGNGNIPSAQSVNSNDGWRYGPQIIFNYIKYFVINFEYRFLLHNSQMTRNFSYEQLIRLVAGKLLTDKISAFVLADLYFRNFKLNSTGENNLNLLYNSMNIDNRIYLKAGYEISGPVEVYIRTGYQKENLVDNRFSFSGWNTILGIEISN